jgi:spermidine/putrescine transport system substrate-binding protein
LEHPVTRWSDMWRPRYAGQLMGWPLSRYMMGIALKPHITLREWEPAVAAPYLVSGEILIAVGQADDVIEGQRQNSAITCVLPQEGGILWGDNFVIPANAQHKEAAEKLINFLLRPEISAQIINETYYWLPNDAALPLVDPEIRDNPAIFPPSDALQDAEILLPLSSEGEALYAQAWERFLAAGE